MFNNLCHILLTLVNDTKLISRCECKDNIFILGAGNTGSKRGITREMIIGLIIILERYCVITRCSDNHLGYSYHGNEEINA